MNLSNIEFIVATRIDNKERASNVFLSYSFFKLNSINSKFVFVEDSNKSLLTNFIEIKSEDKYIFEQTKKCW